MRCESGWLSQTGANYAPAAGLRQGVCRRGLPQGFAAGVCRRGLPQGFAAGVCRWFTAAGRAPAPAPRSLLTRTPDLCSLFIRCAARSFMHMSRHDRYIIKAMSLGPAYLFIKTHIICV
jgi:hypothetical protein